MGGEEGIKQRKKKDWMGETDRKDIIVEERK